jgi:hypothetical protein
MLGPSTSAEPHMIRRTRFRTRTLALALMLATAGSAAGVEKDAR